MRTLYATPSASRAAQYAFALASFLTAPVTDAAAIVRPVAIHCIFEPTIAFCRFEPVAARATIEPVIQPAERT